MNLLCRFVGVALIVGGSSLWAETPEEQWKSWRLEQRLPVAVLDVPITDLCRRRAHELARSGQLSHVDDQGRGPAMQMRAAGAPLGEYGEVLGVGPWEQVWAAWLASAPHRAVVSDPRWVRWGWGVDTEGPSPVWVLRFWAP